MLKEELGFTQVRIWNIFSLIIYQNAQGYLNYNKLDRILDFLTENGLSPFIELGFKPKIVIKAADEFLINQESEILFHSLMEYERVLNELAAHMVNRYGLEAVETWNFELWHDNRLKIEEEDGWYFPIFDAGYSVLKRISKKLKLAVQELCWAMRAICMKRYSLPGKNGLSGRISYPFTAMAM